MPRPTLSEVRKAIRSFPMFTAVGHDEWEPWSWRHLSDGAIEALIDIGLAMENMMVHPRQCKLNILKLLPLASGRIQDNWDSPNAAENLVQSSSGVHSLLAVDQCTFLFLG